MANYKIFKANEVICSSHNYIQASTYIDLIEPISILASCTLLFFCKGFIDWCFYIFRQASILSSLLPTIKNFICTYN